MSLFSSFGNYLSGLGSSFVNGISSAYNTVKGAIGLGGNQTAAVGNSSSSSQSSQPYATIQAPTNYGGKIVPQVYPGSTGSGSGQNVSTGNYNYIPPTPTTISNFSSGRGGGSGGGSSTLSSNPVFANPAIQQQPTTISAKSSGFSSGGTSSLISSATTGGGSSSISLPSAPSYGNYSGLNQTNAQGLINSNLPSGWDAVTYANFKKANPNLEPTPEDTARMLGIQNPTDVASQDRKKSLQEMLGLIPQKENVLQSPEIIAQNAEVLRQRKAYNDLSAQMNMVINKQTQDINFLDKNAETAGVTKTVYGNQVNEINRQATLRALPIQSAMALAQGNLQLSQEYLKQLTDIKTEAINNAYSYNMAKYNAINDFVTGEQKIKLEEAKTQETRNYQENQDLVKVQSDLLANAIPQHAPQSVINAINMSTTRQQAITAAGVYGGDMLGQENKRLQNQKLIEETQKIRADKNVSNVTFDTSTEAGQLSSVAQNLASKFNTKFSQEQFLSNVKRLAATGDTTQLADYIFSEAISTIGDTATRTKAFGNYRVVKQLSMLEQQLSDYEKRGGDTNILVGKKENVLAKVGLVQNVELRTIGTAITNTMDELARARTGAVISASEEKMYRQLLPGIDKTGTLNKAIISGLNSSLTNDIDSILKFQLTGSGFDTISKYLKPIGSSGSSGAGGVDYTATLDNIFK